MFFLKFLICVYLYTSTCIYIYFFLMLQIGYSPVVAVCAKIKPGLQSTLDPAGGNSWEGRGSKRVNSDGGRFMGCPSFQILIVINMITPR